MLNLRKNLSLSSFAIGEISLLILGIFAFGLLLGNISFVSADHEPVHNDFDDVNVAEEPDDDLLNELLSDRPSETGDGEVVEEPGTPPVVNVPAAVIPEEKVMPVDPPENNNNKNAATTAATTKLLGTISCGNNFFLTNLCSGVNWAFGLATVVGFIATIAGVEGDAALAYTAAVAGGVIAGKTTYGLIGQFKSGNEVGLIGKGTSAAVGVVAALYIFESLYEETDTKEEVYAFQCLPWEAPLGGEHCEECNKDPFRPCSEYRCKSLGQACELLNQGTAEEACTWVNPQDVNSPTIKPWEAALKPLDLEYQGDGIRPPERGTEIVRQGGGCLQAFTPLEFGIETNEPAQCKIDTLHTDDFDQMKYFLGGSNLYRYNHTEILSLPGAPTNANGSIEFPYDGTTELYIRCRDANGNENVDEYVVSMCVDESPDTTPPVIDSFSLDSGSAVTFDIDEVYIEAYVNELAECKWSRTSKTFDEMENNMTCDSSTVEINSELHYTCSDTLTGVEDSVENRFFFRCKDQPGANESMRNVNVESTELVLRGTEPLNIIQVLPEGNEEIAGSTSTVTATIEVETSNGADEGISTCYFSDTGDEGSYVEFFETNSFDHKQDLDLIAGSYFYYLRCIDAGGNADESNVSFSVRVDNDAPAVTRVYREGALKVITDEDAQCVYSLSDCNYNFEEGLALIYSNPSIRDNHFVDWDPEATYHIKCKDDFGNEPNPNACSVVVNAVQY